MKYYDTLLFDLDGVILDFTKAEELSFRETFHAYGVTVTPALFAQYRELNHRRWQAYEKGLIDNEECTVGRFRELFSEMKLDADAKQFALDYQKGLGRGHFLMPHAREVLETLSPKFRLYVVTNGVSSTARDRLQGTDTEKYFRKLFISEEMGAQKPSAEYFEKVEAGIPAFQRAQTLLIGDTLSSDIRGAVNAGIDCCWVNPSHKENDTELIPTCEIDDLRSLLKLPEIEIRLNER